MLKFYAMRYLFVVPFIVSQAFADAPFKEWWLDGAEFRDELRHATTPVYYDYTHTKKFLSKDSIAVRIELDDTFSTGSVTVAAKGLRIENSSTEVLRTVAGEISLSNGKKVLIFTVNNLEPAAIYGWSFSVTNATGQTVLENTHVFYAATADQTTLGLARALLAQVAFEEWDHYGKRGTTTVSGTRYLAGQGEAWCSEYYAWVTDHRLNGILGSTWVEDLRNYFKRYSSEYAGSYIPTKAEAGDYLSMWGTEHSGMFLAFEEAGAKDYMWTIEGNVANRLRIMRREFVTNSFRLGHIVEAQLKTFAQAFL